MDRRIQFELYCNQKVEIMSKCGDLGMEAKITKGIRQGCSLSPLVFKHVEQVINLCRLCKKGFRGLKAGGGCCSNSGGKVREV